MNVIVIAPLGAVQTKGDAVGRSDKKRRIFNSTTTYLRNGKSLESGLLVHRKRFSVVGGAPSR